MKSNNTSKMLIIAVIAIFVAFNALFILIAGLLQINGLNACTVVSWVFMALGFVSFGLFAKMNRDDTALQKATFLGFTITKHCIAYLIVDAVLASALSIIGTLTEFYWLWSLLIQLVVFTLHIAFVMMCFAAKTTVVNVGEKLIQKTSNMRLMRASADSLPSYCKDAAAKQQFAKFAEAVKYSDTVSCAELEEIEHQLFDLIEEMKQLLEQDDVQSATALCDKATRLLQDRNLRCKALK